MSENIIATVNHNRYDHLFKIIFNDKKELLSLYNALADTDYNNPDMLEINTLEDAVFIGMKNDLSFVISDYLNLYEHQSTFSPNLPLRGLFYLSDLYKELYYNKYIYNNYKVCLLTPRFIVFYNGIDELPDRLDLKLSDLYVNKDDNPDLEVIAHIININYGHNVELYEKCRKLEEYSIFVDRVHKTLNRNNRDKHKELLIEIIDSCIKDHILEDILTKERIRIMQTILSQFDADKYVDAIKQQSYDSGFGSGIITGTLNTLVSLYLKSRITKSDAIENSKLSESEFDEAVAQYLDKQKK